MQNWDGATANRCMGEGRMRFVRNRSTNVKMILSKVTGDDGYVGDMSQVSTVDLGQI